MSRSTRCYKISYDGNQPEWSRWSCSLVVGTKDFELNRVYVVNSQTNDKSYHVFTVADLKKDAFNLGGEIIAAYLGNDSPKCCCAKEAVESKGTLMSVLGRFFS